MRKTVARLLLSVVCCFICTFSGAVRVEPPSQSIEGASELDRFGSNIRLSAEFAAVETPATGIVDVYRLSDGGWRWYSVLPASGNQARVDFDFYAGYLVVLTATQIQRFQPRAAGGWRALAPIQRPAGVSQFQEILDSNKDLLLVRSEAGVHVYRRQSLAHTFGGVADLAAVSDEVVVLSQGDQIDVYQLTSNAGYQFAGSVNTEEQIFTLDMDGGSAVAGREYGIIEFAGLTGPMEQWSTETVYLSLDTDVWFGNTGFGQGAGLIVGNDLIVIGQHSDSDPETNSGIAEHFRRGANGWEAVGILAAGSSIDRFGTAFAFNGEWIWIGAPGDDPQSYENSRRVEAQGFAYLWNLPTLFQEGNGNLLNETSVSTSQREERRFEVVIPAEALDASKLVVQTFSHSELYFDGEGYPSEELVLYVKAGSPPSTDDFDCRRFGFGLDATCALENIVPGAVYHVLLTTYDFYTSYNNVRLTATYTRTPFDENLSANGNRLRRFADVPAGADHVNVELSGEQSTPDLYVRRNAKPRPNNFDCRRFADQHNQTCKFTDTSASTYFMLLDPPTPYTDARLRVSYEPEPIIAGNPDVLLMETGLSKTLGGLRRNVVVPDGLDKLEFVTESGTGELDLFVRRGAKPTASVYDCKSRSAGALESCELNGAEPGTYFMLLKAVPSYEDVTLIVRRGGEAEPPTNPNPNPAISLTLGWNATGKLFLNWDGANGNRVDIYRNGVKIKVTANDGRWRDSNPLADAAYQICETENAVCSEEVVPEDR